MDETANKSTLPSATHEQDALMGHVTFRLMHGDKPPFVVFMSPNPGKTEEDRYIFHLYRSDPKGSIYPSREFLDFVGKKFFSLPLTGLAIVEPSNGLTISIDTRDAEKSLLLTLNAGELKVVENPEANDNNLVRLMWKIKERRTASGASS